MVFCPIRNLIMETSYLTLINDDFNWHPLLHIFIPSPHPPVDSLNIMRSLQYILDLKVISNVNSLRCQIVWLWLHGRA